MQENEKNLGNKVANPVKSPVKKKLSDSFRDKPIWNPRGKPNLFNFAIIFTFISFAVVIIVYVCCLLQVICN